MNVAVSSTSNVICNAFHVSYAFRYRLIHLKAAILFTFYGYWFPSMKKHLERTLVFMPTTTSSNEWQQCAGMHLNEKLCDHYYWCKSFILWNWVMSLYEMILICKFTSFTFEHSASICVDPFCIHLEILAVC